MEDKKYTPAQRQAIEQAEDTKRAPRLEKAYNAASTTPPAPAVKNVKGVDAGELGSPWGKTFGGMRR